MPRAKKAIKNTTDAPVVKKRRNTGAANEATTPRFTAEERLRMIAEAAYQRAEARGFQGGSPEQDWLEAEAEVDGRYAKAS